MCLFLRETLARHKAGCLRFIFWHEQRRPHPSLFPPATLPSLWKLSVLKVPNNRGELCLYLTILNVWWPLPYLPELDFIYKYFHVVRNCTKKNQCGKFKRYQDFCWRVRAIRSCHLAAARLWSLNANFPGKKNLCLWLYAKFKQFRQTILGHVLGWLLKTYYNYLSSQHLTPQMEILKSSIGLTQTFSSGTSVFTLCQIWQFFLERNNFTIKTCFEMSYGPF